jgi:hypothetical protein
MTERAFWGMTEISVDLGVPRDTVNVWRLRGALPKEDGFASGTPVWLPATILPWLEAKKVELAKRRASR